MLWAAPLQSKMDAPCRLSPWVDVKRLTLPSLTQFGILGRENQEGSPGRVSVFCEISTSSGLGSRRRNSVRIATLLT